MARPIEDLAKAVAGVLPGFTIGVDVFFGPVRPAEDGIPHECIFMVPGPPEQPIVMPRSVEVKTARVMVRIRGERGDFDGGLALAELVRSTTRDMDVDTISDLSDYFEVRARDGEPNMLGQDDQEHWEFSVNVEMRYVES